MSYAEMVETGRNCHEATRGLPSALLLPLWRLLLLLAYLQFACNCFATPTNLMLPVTQPPMLPVSHEHAVIGDGDTGYGNAVNVSGAAVPQLVQPGWYWCRRRFERCPVI